MPHAVQKGKARGITQPSAPSFLGKINLQQTKNRPQQAVTPLFRRRGKAFRTTKVRTGKTKVGTEKTEVRTEKTEVRTEKNESCSRFCGKTTKKREAQCFHRASRLLLIQRYNKNEENPNSVSESLTYFIFLLLTVFTAVVAGLPEGRLKKIIAFSPCREPY